MPNHIRAIPVRAYLAPKFFRVQITTPIRLFAENDHLQVYNYMMNYTIYGLLANRVAGMKSLMINPILLILLVVFTFSACAPTPGDNYPVTAAPGGQVKVMPGLVWLCREHLLSAWNISRWSPLERPWTGRKLSVCTRHSARRRVILRMSWKQGKERCWTHLRLNSNCKCTGLDWSRIKIFCWPVTVFSKTNNHRKTSAQNSVLEQDL